jgi:NAD(P)H-dependent FMN reductase
MNIVIISASNRNGRQSHRVSLHLFKRMQQLNTHTVKLIDLATLQLPVFEEVLSRHSNPPDELHNLQEAIRQADAFIFVSPEYNGTYTSVLKNAIEYLDEKTFQKKVIGVVSVTTGMNGGIRPALQMQQLALSIWSTPSPAMLLVSQVHEKFDEHGKLIDIAFDKRIDFFLKEFMWLADALYSKRFAA